MAIAPSPSEALDPVAAVGDRLDRHGSSSVTVGSGSIGTVSSASSFFFFSFSFFGFFFFLVVSPWLVGRTVHGVHELVGSCQQALLELARDPLRVDRLDHVSVELVARPAAPQTSPPSSASAIASLFDASCSAVARSIAGPGGRGVAAARRSPQARAGREARACEDDLSGSSRARARRTPRWPA